MIFGLSLSILGAAAVPLLQSLAPQQPAQQGPFLGATSPPSGDTIGYWQQRVSYRIVATLDESESQLRANGTLVYVNNSPDTLREMYFHQYLNAFRPGSKWSASDARENRVRFQDLGPNDIGYERFTQAPMVQFGDNQPIPVIVDYPGAPDSTVAHFRLPSPLAPHDSLRVQFAWNARPSTVLRRQGRRGRTYDFAQWYPKVAVYDRNGWEPNPFVPAGELYGEYGTYDVTLVVRDDQIIASTGVPVAGDPGWARVSRTGPPYLASHAYGDVDRTLPPTADGYRAVRFLAKNVHMFAWSASPDYRYEGATYVRQVPPTHFTTWDTVGVNILYKPADDTIWGGGKVLARTIAATKWLESLWGPYAYPQITNVHRLEGGGTEFPMMIMTGSPSIGLILHEFGHVFTYGILGNNEWRSGWMDEGLTDYQTYWAQKLSPQDRDRIVAPPRLPEGYRVNAVTMPSTDADMLDEVALDLERRTQPIGTPAYDFSEFGIYNEMIYTRARIMYGQLRELMGDSTFVAFAHDYYDRWALKHVDERAMRASAERAYGHPLGWFFDQWVHGTGVMDYELGPYAIYTDAQGFHTVATVDRRGELRHPMPVGVLTASGWTIGRADPLADRSTVTITTADKPIRVELDPYHATFDWDCRNNVPSTMLLGVIPEPRATFDWPWLDQADRSHTLVTLAPAAWWSDPNGAVVGARAKTNYLGLVDQYDLGLGFAARSPTGPLGDKPNVATRLQLWARADNLYLPGMSRPLMNVGADVNYVDGLFKADLSKSWNLSPFIFTPGPLVTTRVTATVAAPSDSLLLPEQWSNANVAELGWTTHFRSVISSDGQYFDAHTAIAGGAAAGGSSEPARGYLRAEGAVGVVTPVPLGDVAHPPELHVRLYGGAARNAPEQRAIFASAADPFTRFNNDLFRARGALLKRPGLNYLPLGGAGLRGFAIDTPLEAAMAVNGELRQRLGAVRGSWGAATFTVSAFGDVASGSSSRYVPLREHFMSDAGAGIAATGRLFDRTLDLRLDAPVFVNQAGLAGWRGLGGNGSFAPRWVLTVGDLW